MEKKSPKAGNTVGIIAAAWVMAVGTVLGMTLFIPMIFAALAYFGAAQINKRLEVNGGRIGGFGPSDSSTSSFQLAVSIETGHLLWGALGFGFALTNTLGNFDIELDAANYFEFLIYLILFLMFCLRPSWWTAALLIAYHCVALVRIPMHIDELIAFSRETETRKSLERGFISHFIFHALAVFSISWYSLQRIKIGDVNFVFWKSLKTETIQTAARSQAISERLSDLADLHSKGLISDADLEMKRREILKDL